MTRAIVPGRAEGEALILDEPLFGLDAATVVPADLPATESHKVQHLSQVWREADNPGGVLSIGNLAAAAVLESLLRQ